MASGDIRSPMLEALREPLPMASHDTFDPRPLECLVALVRHLYAVAAQQIKRGFQGHFFAQCSGLEQNNPVLRRAWDHASKHWSPNDFDMVTHQMGAASEGFLDLVNSERMKEFWNLPFFELCSATVSVDGRGQTVEPPPPDDKLLTEKLNGPYLDWDPAVESLEEAVNKPFDIVAYSNGTARLVLGTRPFVIRVVVSGPASFRREDCKSFCRTRGVFDFATETYIRSNLTDSYHLVAAICSIQGRITISTLELSGAPVPQPEWLSGHGVERFDLQRGDFCFFAFAFCTTNP